MSLSGVFMSHEARSPKAGGRPSVMRSPKAGGSPALGAASPRSSTRSLTDSLGRDLRRQVAPCQRANLAARSPPPPKASSQRSPVPRLSFPTQQRPAQCSPRGSVASQSQGGSAQSSPRGLVSWSERWGNTSPGPSYPRSPSSQSVSTLPRGLAGGSRPRAVSPQLTTQRMPGAPSAASVRPRAAAEAAAQAKQTSEAVESALRAVKQALQTASKVAAGPPAARMPPRGFSMDGSPVSADRTPPGSASIRFSRSPLAAARQSNKQKLHAVARSQSFTDSILDKLDDLRDTLATSSCSTTVGECSPRDSVFSVYSR